MTDPVFGGDEVRTEQEIARWAAGVTAKAEKYQEMSRQVAGVSITEVSRDGLVRLTVDATGAMQTLEISERASGGAQLAATILTTMRRAQSRIAGAVSDVVGAVGIREPGTADALVSSYRRRFPEPPSDTPPWADQVRPTAPPPPPPTRRPVQDDDDWEGPSVTE
ncbi:YbaB/EbfC family nucleoid-associated protein [Saccharothrix yanglingensis]|uniref:YbaB/EbfC family nucleoid-associated protein n=1 Tax=Saccharothrix yanglingensis TaxID=659496 RepID=UPI0027D31308|nr:YbaB/EbfC family nucleoid-associated protein [Saccharothrix yanglingensis]